MAKSGDDRPSNLGDLAAKKDLNKSGKTELPAQLAGVDIIIQLREMTHVFVLITTVKQSNNTAGTRLS